MNWVWNELDSCYKLIEVWLYATDNQMEIAIIRGE